jgi:hypothetical protein
VNDEAGLWELLSTYRRSAWRLEALGRYTTPHEAPVLAAYLRGDPPPPPDAAFEQYLDILRALPAQGRSMGRVHAIAGTLTPYLRYEIEWGYAPLAAAGEDVRILHRPSWRDTPFRQRPPDFWLVDEEKVALMEYDDEGRWLGMRLLTEPAEVAEYCELRDLAVGDAVPYAEYIAAMRRAPLDPSSMLVPTQRIA